MEEKNLDVVTYCGLCCLDCHGHTGKIADLARECNEPEACEKLRFLEPVHGDAHLRNIRMIRKKGINGFIRGKRNWRFGKNQKI
jgi:hypothetical protein